MRIVLDPTSPVPLYRQISEAFRRQIIDGIMRPGEQLPTVRDVGRSLSLNFNTVARAYRLLEAEGLISSRQGQGSFVVPEGEAGTADDRLLEAMTSEFLWAAYRAGFSANEVHWEFSSALRRWMQSGEPGS